MNQIFPHIIPEISDWPVARQSRERGAFIERLNAYVTAQLISVHGNNLQDLITKAIYMENQRIKLTPWKVDPPDEKAYWKSIAADLEAASLREDRADAEEAVLKRIVNRYSEEIVGNFIPRAFQFSRIFLTSFFKRIFSSYFSKGQWRWGSKKALQDRIKIKGNVELIRTLFAKGTVVMMPTHYSNLDSIMVGYSIDTNVGLPSFSYGAGLNLFNVELVGYFIDRLGAFRVDRRKKNPIYLECLKSMATISVTEGVNCLFFPGGTRSRSGETETKLKLGLISSVIEAQRLHIEKNDGRKVYVVPLNLGYNFVLEAPHLIDQHLQSVGKEKYKRTRMSGPTFSSILHFLRDLYTRSSEVYMSFGDPLDVFGNRVDAEGRSYDKFGNVVDMRSYFELDGQLTHNSQREGIYARLLGESVVRSYRKFNVILTTNVVAYSAFHSLYAEYEASGLLNLMNQSNRKFTIDKEDFNARVTKVVNHIAELAGKGEVTLSDENWSTADLVMEQGLAGIGIYHQREVLKMDKKGHLYCEDIRLLYFYHNRLTNYHMEETLGWPKV